MLVDYLLNYYLLINSSLFITLIISLSYFFKRKTYHDRGDIMYKPIKLEYQTDSLEPFIDTHTVGLHYYKHYLNYLKKLNELLKSINYQFEYPLVLLNYHINEFPQEKKEDILFNLGGVLNHELYFNSISISPKPPKGKLKQKIDIQFGNLENLFSELKKTSLNLKGSGYTF